MRSSTHHRILIALLLSPLVIAPALAETSGERAARCAVLYLQAGQSALVADVISGHDRFRHVERGRHLLRNKNLSNRQPDFGVTLNEFVQGKRPSMVC